MTFSEFVLRPKERLVTSYRPLLFLTTLSISDWVQKKNKVNFFEAF